MSIQGLRRRFDAALDSDVFFSFRTSRLTVAASVVLALILLSAVLAPWIAPHDPFDISALDLMNSELPPAWEEGGDARYLLGTDLQARDVLSSILYGSRVSLLVGFASVLFEFNCLHHCSVSLQASHNGYREDLLRSNYRKNVRLVCLRSERRKRVVAVHLNAV